MKFEKEETRLLNRENRIYLAYECPMLSCKKPIAFRNNTGYQNPCNHLQICFGRGNSETDAKEIIQQPYKGARQTTLQYGGTIRANFRRSSLSEYEKAIYQYVKYIIIKNVPGGHIESNEFRSISKYDFSTGAKTLRSVILIVAKLAENIIINEISGKQEALIYNGWDCYGTNYVG